MGTNQVVIWGRGINLLNHKGHKVAQRFIKNPSCYFVVKDFDYAIVGIGLSVIGILTAIIFSVLLLRGLGKEQRTVISGLKRF